MANSGASRPDLAQLQAELAAGLVTQRLGKRLMVSQSLPSTQDWARELAREGADEGAVVWALQQTAARGRLGRSWQAPAGGLWFSVLLRPSLRPHAAAFLSIVAGVAVAEALRQATGAEVRLKWPNDLLLRGGKLGGVLCEAEVQDEELRSVVVGVGVNLDPLPAETLADIGRAAWLRDGATPGAVAEPPALLAAIINGLEQRYDQYLADGPGAARLRWIELSDTIGTHVRADTPDFWVEGDAFDLDPDGALVLRTPEMKALRVHSGEVIHLRPA